MWASSVLLYVFSDSLGIDGRVQPLALFIVLAVYLVNPFPGTSLLLLRCWGALVPHQRRKPRQS